MGFDDVIIVALMSFTCLVIGLLIGSGGCDCTPTCYDACEALGAGYYSESDDGNICLCYKDGELLEGWNEAGGIK